MGGKEHILGREAYTVPVEKVEIETCFITFKQIEAVFCILKEIFQL